MKIKLFTSKSCPKCLPAKKLMQELEKEGLSIEYHDTESVDGMAEAAFHEVLATPTTIILDNNSEERESWRGETPDKNKILKLLNK